MPSCNAEDFVLYFFLCFRSLRDRAPASDAGSGGSSPFGSIFCCLFFKNITFKAHCILFESTLSLGSGLTAVRVRLEEASFQKNTKHKPRHILSRKHALARLRPNGTKHQTSLRSFSASTEASERLSQKDMAGFISV